MCRNFLSGLIHDLRLITEYRSSHRMEAAISRQGAHNGERSHFCHAPELLKRCSEPPVPFFILDGGQVLGECDVSERMGAIRGAVWLVEKHPQRGGEKGGHGAAIFNGLFKEAACTEAAHDGDARASNQRGPKGMTLRGRMVERQRDQMAIIAAKTRGTAKNFSAIDEVRVGQHDALRAGRRT